MVSKKMSKRQQIEEINKVVQRYIVLAAPDVKTAKKLLKWWYSED